MNRTSQYMAVEEVKVCKKRRNVKKEDLASGYPIVLFMLQYRSGNENDFGLDTHVRTLDIGRTAVLTSDFAAY